MLRRKLLFHLGPLILLLVGLGVGSILMLQGVLGGLSAAKSVAQVDAVARDFRLVVLLLAVAFLVIVNVSVLALLRMSTMILRPMDKLLVATEQLALEHFDARVTVDSTDEFNQLALAYNALAERLESNERKRMDILQQVAVAVNHELNNCVGTIDLQLRLVGKRAPDCPGLGQSLHQIDESLRRITTAVQSLKNVRRIVLTDYLPGTKMLDIQRSVQDEPAAQEIGSRAS